MAADRRRGRKREGVAMERRPGRVVVNEDCIDCSNKRSWSMVEGGGGVVEGGGGVKDGGGGVVVVGGGEVTLSGDAPVLLRRWRRRW